MESLWPLLVVLGILYLVTPAIAIGALVKANGLARRLQLIEQRLGIEAPQVAESELPGAGPVRPAAAPPPVAETPPEPRPAQPKPAQPKPAQPKPAKPDAATPAPAPAPAPEPPRGVGGQGVGGQGVGDLEQAFGTRWVVWIGGLALALGGVFLVRYSIEAGLHRAGLKGHPRRAVRAGAGPGRRAAAPRRSRHRLRRHPGGLRAGDADRGRHRHRLCHGVVGLRALRLPAAGGRLPAARGGGGGRHRRARCCTARRWRRSARWPPTARPSSPPRPIPAPTGCSCSWPR